MMSEYQSTQHHSLGDWYPTNLGPSQIRIFFLLPGIGFDPLQATIAVIDLQSKKPQFTAISYNWIDLETKDTIYFDNTGLRITRDLAVCLRQIRHPERHIPLWADAICIDQQNTLELETQIPMIAKVFSQAKDVIIWLGPENEWSAQLFDDLNHRVEKKDPEPFRVHDLRYYSEVEQWKRRRAFWLEKPGFMQSMVQLLQHPYWSRSWIKQEIFLARDLHICCGDRVFAPSSSPLLMGMIVYSRASLHTEIQDCLGYQLISHHFEIYQQDPGFLYRPEKLLSRKKPYQTKLLRFEGLPTPQTLLSIESGINSSHLFLSAIQSCNSSKALQVDGNLWTHLGVVEDEITGFVQHMPGVVYFSPCYESNADHWLQAHGKSKTHSWAFFTVAAANRKEHQTQMFYDPAQYTADLLNPHVVGEDIICGLRTSASPSSAYGIDPVELCAVFERPRASSSTWTVKLLGMPVRRRSCWPASKAEALSKCANTIESFDLERRDRPKDQLPQEVVSTGLLPWFWHVVPGSHTSLPPVSHIEMGLTTFIALVQCFKTFSEEQRLLRERVGEPVDRKARLADPYYVPTPLDVINIVKESAQRQRIKAEPLSPQVDQYTTFRWRRHSWV